MSTAQIASDAKIASAMTKLGMTAFPQDDSLVLKAVLVALGNVGSGGGGASNALLLAGATASTLAGLTAATAATGGLFYGTQAGADRKFTLTAAGAAVVEAADAAAQRTALGAAGFGVNDFTDTQTITKTTGLSSTTPQLNLVGYGANISVWDDFVGGSLAASLSIGTFKARVISVGSDTAALDGPNNAVGLAKNNRLYWSDNASVYYTTPTLILSQAAPAMLQLGTNDPTTPTAQRIKAHNVTTGTGANLELAGGTGSVADGVVKIVNGRLNVTGIPTSSAGLATGDIYSNAGILTVV